MASSFWDMNYPNLTRPTCSSRSLKLIKRYFDSNSFWSSLRFSKVLRDSTGLLHKFAKSSSVTILGFSLPHFWSKLSFSGAYSMVEISSSLCTFLRMESISMTLRWNMLFPKSAIIIILKYLNSTSSFSLVIWLSFSMLNILLMTHKARSYTMYMQITILPSKLWHSCRVNTLRGIFSVFLTLLIKYSTLC